MSHQSSQEKATEIMETDFPVFMEHLIEKYGEEWCAKHIGAGIIALEDDVTMTFSTNSRGKMQNQFRLVHGVLRNMARNIESDNPHDTELDKFNKIVQTVIVKVTSDIMSAGIPDTIYNAFMLKQHENEKQS